VEITAAESDIKEEKRKKGLYALQNLTTWQLKKEQANVCELNILLVKP
jgi:fructose-1,6-bisphosphatase I